MPTWKTFNLRVLKLESKEDHHGPHAFRGSFLFDVFDFTRAYPVSQHLKCQRGKVMNLRDQSIQETPLSTFSKTSPFLNQLRFLTQSGVSVLPGDLTRLPLAAPIWGLAKALRAERPDLKVAVMDLEKLEAGILWERWEMVCMDGR